MHELHKWATILRQGRVLMQGLIKVRELSTVVSPFPQQLATNPHLLLMCVTTTNFLFRLRNTENRPRGVQMFDGSMHCRQLMASRNCHMITRLASNKTMRSPPFANTVRTDVTISADCSIELTLAPLAFWHFHLQVCKTSNVEDEKCF